MSDGITTVNLTGATVRYKASDGRSYEGLVKEMLPPDRVVIGLHHFAVSDCEVISAVPSSRDTIADCLRMGRGMYPSPEDWADAVLKRLAHEGFAVVRITG